MIHDSDSPLAPLRRYEPHPVGHLVYTCRDAIDLADEHGDPVAFRFCETPVVALPGETAIDVAGRWSEERVRRQAAKAALHVACGHRNCPHMMP